MDLKLRNAVVLITGASRGLGKDFALAFADEGARVAICARDAAKLEESKKTGVPVPSVHSPLWAPVREPTIKAAIRAETAILMDLLNGKSVQ